MENLTILVVDDDPVIRRLLEQRLAKQSYVVSVAENGQQAEAALREQPFDVVLTDLMMPGGIGGIEVLEITKNLYPDTQVVLITAHSSIDSAVEAMKKGATDYLEKPINFDELFLRLDKIANVKTILRSAKDIEQAMTVTESAASETIQNLEMTVAKKQQLIDAVEDLLTDDTLPEDERIARAITILCENGN
ncbi:sigma-54-dependent transcriptional regulator [Desulfofustis glycolicus]|uniref:Two-component system, cell cycle response regulator n=1 Tax=Desulfofustis glycolicus DSM 9705 TaxID=1121409 RepID=A0A1M5U2W4_9BACT|nr:response regulator [Desulfofustis glycolicus]MCB2214686.1 response regulator [Desulfobulbaceae bacterium]SHH57309.1 two-component system, cell cycle response regulator [Desulfofustis glycolicus DSM 9705]